MSDASQPQTELEVISRQRVKQHRSTEDYVRLVVVGLIAAWLFSVVVMPLWEVIERATNAEFTVAVWDDGNEFRIAGRRIVFDKDENEIVVDGQSLTPVDGQIDFDGVAAGFARDGHWARARKVELRGEWIETRPIEVRVRGNAWIIDGTTLGPDDYLLIVPRFIGLKNFNTYFTNANLRIAVFNSIKVGAWTTVISVLLAFLYAFGLTRTAMPAKLFFRVVAMLPLFAPTMLYGLSLVYLFGNKGLVTHQLLGLQFGAGNPFYGFWGILIAEVTFTFPPALMILTVALSNTDARLYEAASSLGAGKIRTFLTVTLPGVKYGLISAVFVCFTLSFTDFGAPKVVGGQYTVLAVDIYKQVVGQQNFGMGATVSIILLIPAVISFIADRIIQRRASAAITARAVPLVPKKTPSVDWPMFGVCCLIAACILTMLFMAGYGSLLKMWPYDLSLTLKHYLFADTSGSYKDYWNSLRMAGLTAVIGAALTFVTAYLIEKTKGMTWLRQIAYFLSILPLALPGLVIGIAYIFFFNNPSNPMHGVYGTVWVMVIANIVHFFTVSFLTCTTALRQLDKEFETVSESMSVPFYVTFFRVTVPVCLPAILEVMMFYFVSSMATVSALIFLYSTDTRVAAVAVVNMSDAGDETAASAMCMLIVLTNIVVRLLFEGATYFLRRSTEAWRKR